ncbi:Gfo/Idh/MocA family protein [Streptomyces ipomoeae]|uniref:Gfo/Idh/MocA family protein n=1 Tax=Streptomyces ipomoeae TaxID=103232 RepID=UPI0011468E24|nr:Gfo/Idh/MocA family oxidoreductase [Streptomyces ipomoeae]TQE33083.1 Gfo/Idh/MocA family oxidoreductase [Streptomyces ipomoeae]
MTPTPAARPWRLAVAGCGAAAFGLHLPILTSSAAFDVIAVTDRDPARARTAAARFAVPRTTTRVGELLSDADVLVILTGVHDSLIEEALDAGVHVVTEKPVCLDVVRTRKLAARAKDAGLLLDVGAMRAYDPALHAALAHVPEPAGGWLVKADGVDEAARRRVLPGGFAPYTFADDPPQPVPEHLEAHQVTALQILLWQGYHLLTALVLAVPGTTAAACSVDPAGQSVHALLHGPNGEPFTLVIGATPAGVFREQIHFADPVGAATLDFTRPYEPSATTRLTTADGTQSGFGDPFTAMWAAVAARLSGQHPADLPTSSDLAVRVEDLALALAGLARPHARTRKDARS